MSAAVLRSGTLGCSSLGAEVEHLVVGIATAPRQDDVIPDEGVQVNRGVAAANIFLTGTNA